jgi:hypothetical protein
MGGQMNGTIGHGAVLLNLDLTGFPSCSYALPWACRRPISGNHGAVPGLLVNCLGELRKEVRHVPIMIS